MSSALQKQDVLIECLPYIHRFEGKTLVIKYGGAAMENVALKASFAQDVTLLKKIGVSIVVVHGGGKEINELAHRLQIPTRFINGQRYTDARMLEVVQMVLAGSVNKEIVREINLCHGSAVGLSGIDGSLLRATRYQEADLGLVGTVTGVNTDFLNQLLTHKHIPVIAPLGVDSEGVVYNINADAASGAVAGALRAAKLVYLSDVEGIYAEGKLLHSLTQRDAQQLLSQGVVTDGMIPKLTSALDALNAGVNKAHVIDGRIPHALLLEVFTDEGVGTEVIREPIIDELS
ncbi:MAG: acetylglutamate kinase [Bacteroidota bacterium]